MDILNATWNTSSGIDSSRECSIHAVVDHLVRYLSVAQFEDSSLLITSRSCIGSLNLVSVSEYTQTYDTDRRWSF